MKRKVRKDFDPVKGYSVDVSNCTEDEKEEVQQAFFDVGMLWSCGASEYRYLESKKYTNKYITGDIATHLLYGFSSKGCNMNAKEFLELVYEPEQQGHVHAELMAQYAEDAQTHAEPWELWQAKAKGGVWMDCLRSPRWVVTKEYRRKPKTHVVHGVEIPDLRVTPELGSKYYLADPTSTELAELHTFVMRREMMWFERGLSYQYSEEGRLAAVLHSKAMLGID